MWHREPDTPPQEPRHRTASPVGHSPTISTPDENLQARLGRLEKVFDEVSELKKHILEFTAVIPPAAGTCEHSSRQHGHDNAHEQPRVDRHGPPSPPPPPPPLPTSRWQEWVERKVARNGLHPQSPPNSRGSCRTCLHITSCRRCTANVHGHDGSR